MIPYLQAGLDVEGADSSPEMLAICRRKAAEAGLSPVLYQQPMHFAQLFASRTNNLLPIARQSTPDAERFSVLNTTGVQYHLNYLTPYWDPEGGFRVDANYASGVPILREHRAFNRVDGQFSTVRGLPDCLGPLSQTHLAAR